MDDIDFLKAHSSFFGEEITNFHQIDMIKFNGHELKSYINFILSKIKETKVKSKISKWYAVPPYNLRTEQWVILNNKGELIATFETQEDNEEIDFLNKQI